MRLGGKSRDGRRKGAKASKWTRQRRAATGRSVFQEEAGTGLLGATWQGQGTTAQINLKKAIIAE